jgi:hypothetical protein
MFYLRSPFTVGHTNCSNNSILFSIGGWVAKRLSQKADLCADGLDFQ